MEESQASQQALPPKEYFQASLTLRNRMSIAIDIAKTLTSSQKVLFEGTCFGSWLQVQQGTGDPLLTHLFLQHLTDELPEAIQRGHEELWFHFSPFYYARFGPEEFCLVTALRFGRHDSFGPYIQHIHSPLWVFRVFPDYNMGGDGLKVTDFEKVFEKGHSSGLDDMDFVRVCLILLVEAGFNGRQPSQHVSQDLLLLVENLEAWNVFPWGSYLWRKVYKQLSTNRVKRGEKGGPGRAYTLIGFLWAFKPNQNTDQQVSQSGATQAVPPFYVMHPTHSIHLM